MKHFLEVERRGKKIFLLLSEYYPFEVHGCNVYIKVEKCDHSSNTLQKDNILIKEEKFSFLSSQPLENVSTDHLTVVEIKTEIKLEPKIESSIPAAKISFGFNAMKKLRKT